MTPPDGTIELPVPISFHTEKEVCPYVQHGIWERCHGHPEKVELRMRFTGKFGPCQIGACGGSPSAPEREFRNPVSGLCESLRACDSCWKEWCL